MAGVKIAAFHKASDGCLIVRQITDNDRMTLETFKEIYKGRVATPEEIRDARVRNLPEGMGVWRREDGSFWAIRNEN